MQFRNCVCAKLRFTNKVESELEHLISVEKKSFFSCFAERRNTAAIFSDMCFGSDTGKNDRVSEN